MNLLPGSYVTHAKLPQLGSGEIMAMHDDTISIRFADGHRDFKIGLVVRHLTVTNEAPAAPPPKARRSKPAAKPKT